MKTSNGRLRERWWKKWKLREWTIGWREEWRFIFWLHLNPVAGCNGFYGKTCKIICLDKSDKTNIKEYQVFFDNITRQAHLTSLLRHIHRPPIFFCYLSSLVKIITANLIYKLRSLFKIAPWIYFFSSERLPQATVLICLPYYSMTVHFHDAVGMQCSLPPTWFSVLLCYVLLHE